MAANTPLYLLALLLAVSAAAAAAVAVAPSRKDATEEPPFTLDEDTTEELPFTMDESQDPPELPIPFESNDHLEWVEGEFERINPSHVNGQELFEGDILLTPEQRRLMAQRKATPSLSRRWTLGTDGFPLVHYIFSDTLVDQTAVNNSIDHWQEHTCIKFQVKSATQTVPHLAFFKGSGCWSYVGMLTSSGQQISIGNNCNSLGTVVHEIGHAMGFNHEQSRSDRDDFVSINTANIISNKLSNFEKRTDNNYSVPYDFSSDMHYNSRAFTINGKLTIVTKNPLAQELVGQRTGLSHYDKLLANTMYPCITKWLEACSLSSDPCQNDGYMGKDCKCVCRSGTSGNNCETVTESYYDSLLSGCSENITTSGNVTSPSYPSKYPSGLRCVKWIQAPECTTVQVKFNAFNLYGRNDYCNSDSCCYFDALEIRTDDLYNGNVYCATDIAAGTIFNSTTNQLILYFETRTNFYTGWTADVVFVPVSGCTTTTAATTSTTSTTTSPTTTTTTTPTTTSTTSTTTTPTTTSTTTTSTTTPTTTTTTPTTTTTTSTTTPTTTTTSTPTPTTTTTSTTTPTTTTTSTTTPTTTTTSTTTPTTTTTSTTTPTTTTTSTTTPTTTTTSTIVPTTPTTSLPTANCTEDVISSSLSHWTSPNFGQSNYTNNGFCSLFRSSSAPFWVRIRLNSFELEEMSGNTCYDYVSFSRPNTFGDLTICDTQTGEICLPSFNFDAVFSSDYDITAPGFNVTIERETSNCHKLIQTGGVGTVKTIKPPKRANNSWTKKACEWWIRSPAGTKIQLKFKKMRLTTGCSRSSVIVNKYGDASYPTTSSGRYCGRNLPPTTISDTNEMNIMFFTNKARKGFVAKMTVIPA